MFALKVDDNILQRKLDEISKSAFPSAVMVALTRTAAEVRKEEYVQMRKVFDRPTPYTMRSIFITPATRGKLVAFVSIKSRSYMLPQVYGGSRKMKRSEQNLQGKWFVPAKTAPLNQYGNMSMAVINRIVSQLNLQRDTSANTTERSKRKAKGKRATYFAKWQSEGKMPAGIYSRSADGLKLVLLFPKKKPAYKTRLHFQEVAEKVFAKQFKRQFDIALGQAVGRRLGRGFQRSLF